MVLHGAACWFNGAAWCCTLSCSARLLPRHDMELCSTHEGCMNQPWRSRCCDRASQLQAEMLRIHTSCVIVHLRSPCATMRLHSVGLANMLQPGMCTYPSCIMTASWLIRSNLAAMGMIDQTCQNHMDFICKFANISQMLHVHTISCIIVLPDRPAISKPCLVFIRRR